MHFGVARRHGENPSRREGLATSEMPKMTMKQTQLHALVIDDEAQVRSFIALVLSSEGWEVSEAESAERAFEMLHAQDWSLVLCDVLLGGERSEERRVGKGGRARGWQ